MLKRITALLQVVAFSILGGLLICPAALAQLVALPPSNIIGTNPGSEAPFEIRALKFDDQGNLYVGGTFKSLAGDTKKSLIAKWNGTNWESLGGGLSGERVNAIEIVNGHIYVGGKFSIPTSNSDSIGANSIAIASWNGSSWSAVGGGLPGGEVHALAGYESSLYVGGDFIDARTAAGLLPDSNSPSYLAKWTGSSWVKVAENAEPRRVVYSLHLAYSNSYLLVGASQNLDGENPFNSGIGICPLTGADCVPFSGVDMPSPLLSITSWTEAEHQNAFFFFAGGEGESHLSHLVKGKCYVIPGYPLSCVNPGQSDVAPDRAVRGLVTLSQPRLTLGVGDFDGYIFQQGDSSISEPDASEAISVITAYESADLRMIGIAGRFAMLNGTSAPAGLAIYNAEANGTWQSVPLDFYKLYGSVTIDGQPIVNTLMELAIAGEIKRFFTDSRGRYAFRLPRDKSYSLVPKKLGYSFDVAVGTVSADKETNFTGTLIAHQVLGNVKVDGVQGAELAKVVIDGGLLGATSADEAGNYSFGNVRYGIPYRIRPSLPGYVFSPEMQEGLVSSDITANFTATRVTRTLRGVVKIGRTPLEGVLIDVGTLGRQRTDKDGRFIFRGIPGGSDCTLRASLSGYTFTPEFQSCSSDAEAGISFKAKKANVVGAAVNMVSISSLDAQGDTASGDLNQGAVAISEDGRYVVFSSSAPNLSHKDTNTKSDVFIRDQEEGLTERISINASGREADDDSGLPAEGRRAVSISGGGEVIAFTSLASNLVLDDANEVSDVFIFDRSTLRHDLLSQSSGGLYGDGPSHSPMISQGGRYAVFVSEATNLVDVDGNGVADIFRRDIVEKTTERVSVSASGEEANGPSRSPAIDALGTKVVFSSSATNLVTGDSNEAEDVFIKTSGAITRIVSANGAVEPNGPSLNPVISADGNIVAFASDASNLFLGDANGVRDVFAYNISTGDLSIVSVSSDGSMGNLESGIGQISISEDGRFIAFTSLASNLVVGDDNGLSDVFVHDRVTGRTGLLSKSATGRFGGLASGGASISANGKVLAFTSAAENLVSPDTNEVADVFSADIGPLPAVFRKQETIEDAPTLVSNKKRLTIVMQFFNAPGSESLLRRLGTSRADILAGKTKVQYVVTLRKRGAISRKTTKRNTLTIGNMSPGNYSVTYHAELKRDSRVIGRTKESPKQKLKIIG